jgi:hypothetical protein
MSRWMARAPEKQKLDLVCASDYGHMVCYLILSLFKQGTKFENDTATLGRRDSECR